MANNKSSLKNIHRLISEATKEAPLPASFLADLKRSIEMESENKSLPSNTYKPSSLTCVRNMYFQVIGAPLDGDNRNAALIRITECGTSSHEYLQSHIAKMKEYGMDCEYIDVGEYIKANNLNHLEIKSRDGMETKLHDNELNLRFKCDGIIRYKGKYYILEIKTETSSKFMSREGVAEEHKAQASAYALSLRLDEVMFLYESREFCDWKCYLFKASKEFQQEYVINKIKLSNDCIQEGRIPPRPADAGAKLCRYCNYVMECKKAGV